MSGSPQQRSFRSRRTAATWVVAIAATTALANLATTPAPRTVEAAFENTAAVTGSGCGTTTFLKSTGDPWVCSFSDNFSGTTLDLTKWSPMLTKQTGVLTPECRVANKTNISVVSGALRLTVRKEAKPFTCYTPTGSYKTQYTGGNVTTAGKWDQTGGRFEIRAKFPATKIAGLHSALWMWPRYPIYHEHSGEIDIAEYRTGHPGYVVPYVHYTSETPDPNRTNNWCAVNRPEDFHTYVLEWTIESLKISYDGKVCIDDPWMPAAPLVHPAPFNRPFYLILTQALGINQNAFVAGTTPLPSTMQIDYVRVWS
jgi:beta-glucanase (GH16 family)